MTTWQQNRIGTALNGIDPMVMAEMPGNFALFVDTQFLPGYSVLLPKRVVGSLNDLLVPERVRFLKDMSILEAVQDLCFLIYFYVKKRV